MTSRDIWTPRRRARRAIALAVAAAAVVSWAGSTLADDHTQDMQIGNQVYADMLSKGLIVQQSPFYQALRATGVRIDKAASPHWFTTQFIIIQGNSVNAFSAPDGRIYVNVGLLRSADNADELAAVLGHEMGHLVLGHVVARTQTQAHMNAFSQFMQKFVHSKGAENTYTAATIVGQYGFLNFTRSQEYAADQKGVDLAARAGYNPWGSVWFFQEIEKLYGDAGFEQYVQEHPSTTNRIERIESYIKSQPKKFGHFSPTLRDTSGLPMSQKGDTLQQTPH
ncbi:MAG: M48 family metalloprotease [Candidatus Eremiobacteraeota bacterium]|nr:M48 family metalloprotease [Candidatus Eremiobacteraeota bacterium]